MCGKGWRCEGRWSRSIQWKGGRGWESVYVDVDGEGGDAVARVNPWMSHTLLVFESHVSSEERG